MAQEQAVQMDIDVYGEENPDGTGKEYYDDQATSNAIISWLTSRKGDYLRNPGAGGIIDRLLFKPMNGQTAQLMSFTIQNAFANEFSPEVKLQKLAVIPNYELRYWEIEIQYENPFNKKVNSVNVYTKDLSVKDSYDYIDVDYIGDNLYEFCETKLPGMNGEFIVYSSLEESWLWGRYKLSNFSASDTRYSDILTLVNGGA